jgi:hypothetical protein
MTTNGDYIIKDLAAEPCQSLASVAFQSTKGRIMKLATLLLVLLAPFQAHAEFIAFNFKASMDWYDAADDVSRFEPCVDCVVRGQIIFDTFLNGTPPLNGYWGRRYDSNISSIVADFWTGDRLSYGYGPHGSYITTYGELLPFPAFFSSIILGADQFSFAWQRRFWPPLPNTLTDLMRSRRWQRFGLGVAQFSFDGGEAFGRVNSFERVPAPGTLALFALALAIFAVSRRGARSSDQ